MEEYKIVERFPMKKDVLDDLIEMVETDEISLLDLIYIEEMVSQNRK